MTDRGSVITSLWNTKDSRSYALNGLHPLGRCANLWNSVVHNLLALGIAFAGYVISKWVGMQLGHPPDIGMMRGSGSARTWLAVYERRTLTTAATVKRIDTLVVLVRGVKQQGGEKAIVTLESDFI